MQYFVYFLIGTLTLGMISFILFDKLLAPFVWQFAIVFWAILCYVWAVYKDKDFD